MNRKGFTLIELLAVIIILAIILLIAVPQVLNTIKGVRLNAFIVDEDMSIKAAKKYVLSNSNSYPNEIGESTEITLADLESSGILGSFSSPFNNGNLCSGYVTITKIAENDYEYVPFINCSNNISNSSEDGLVLYYSFDDFQEPTENLLVDGDFKSASSSWNMIQHSTGGIDDEEYGSTTIVNWDNYQYISWIVGEDYTASGYSKKETSTSISARFCPHAPDSELSLIAYSGIVDATSYGYNLTLAIADEWQYFEGQIHANVDFSNNLYLLESQKNGYDTVAFDKLQLKKKAYSTPFVDGTRDGLVKDYSSNSNNAELDLNSTPRWVEDSYLGEGAYYFDGEKTQITVPDDASLNNSVISLSAWVNPSVLTSGEHQRLITKNEVGGYLLNLYGRTIESYIGSDYVAGPTINTNEWTNAVVTIEAGILKLYINGELYSSNEYTGIINSSGVDLTIGSDGTSFFNGYLDDIRIYNRALTKEEIKEYYDTSVYKH